MGLLRLFMALTQNGKKMSLLIHYSALVVAHAASLLRLFMALTGNGKNRVALFTTADMLSQPTPQASCAQLALTKQGT